MDEQTVLANLEQRIALELGRQSMMRMRAEIERDLASQMLAQQAAEAEPTPLSDKTNAPPSD